MLKVFAYLLLLIQSDEFKNVQPNFVISNGFYGYGIKTPLTDTTLSYIDPSGVVNNRFNMKHFLNTSIKMNPVKMIYRNMETTDIEGYDKIQFKSPKVLLGDKFDERFTKKLCETCSLAACNKIKRFEYTKIGKKVCRQICQQQNKLIICPMGKAKLTHSYCTKVGSHLMQTNTCICTFEISFNDEFNFVFFHFTPNYNGQLSMVYFEAGSICQ